ncbi:ATP-grasp domain-containing protein [Ferruginivarius sediminum]|uniref:Alpha-L-glutamate ligase n=1 Tax=Ferruginivarius sediminum TaxID=2661937 RepID=A0A369TFX2_9PROT|nr:alpha-L-glutamate ligase [Ferruginivarius sediminum]RDD61796.1 alpha-L-glutamate ligase [Ferruginivarius sediminum]
MSKIHVLHENDAWTRPLFDALNVRGLRYESWHLAEGVIEPAGRPPEGVFYNRMSASAHTRGHRFAPELTRHVLTWLETAGRRVVNNSSALSLEVSKLGQYAALEAAGVRTPRTIGAVGRESVLHAARQLDEAPFILKPNRGGTGAGVQLMENVDQLAAILDDPATEQPLDGTWLVQQYIRAAEPTITRCEFIGGQFFYAVRVDTSQGFDLCPADVCEVPAQREKFEIIDGFDDPVLTKYASFLANNGIEVAGIEFIRDRAGTVFTYDVNTNTNYNSRAEAVAGVSGMERLADFLGRELERVQSARAA